MAIEVNEMLRFMGKPQSGNDRVKRQHNLCHADITMHDGAKIEAFGKFPNEDDDDFICYLIHGRALIGGQSMFYIKTNTDLNHSVDTEGEYIVVECKGVYLEHEKIADIKYKVLDYNSAEEAEELIYNYSQAIGTMLRTEDYHYNASRQWFEGLCD